MLKVIQSIFKKDIPVKKLNTFPSHEKSIEEYFQEELNNCHYIKKEFHKIIIADFLHKEKMSPEIKKAIFNEQGQALKSPDQVLSEIYNRSTIVKNRHDSFRKSTKIGVKKFKLMVCGDHSECNWCKQNSDKEMGLDILKIIENNCQCKPYSKCFIESIITF